MTWKCPYCNTEYETGKGWYRDDDGDNRCIKCGGIVYCACGRHR